MTNQNNLDFTLRWNQLHTTILSSFISGLNENGIKYFILRNYEELPENNKSKDVDIIIEPGSYKHASNILKSVFKSHSIPFHWVVKYERVRCWFGIDPDNSFSIHIDLIEGYLSKGFEIFSFELLYKNTFEYKEFRVLNSSFDAIMLLYYKVIGTKQLKEDYKKKIASIYLKESEKIDQILSETLGKKCSSVIIQSLRKNDFETIIKSASSMSLGSKRKVFFRKPLKTGFQIIQFFTEKFWRIVICPRKFQNFIAVLGADGTGKSTFIDGLIRAIAYYYVSDLTKSHIYHHRPTLFMNLGAIGEKAGVKQDTNFTNPHRGKPTGFTNSFLRMTYYWLDYFVGAPLMLRKDVQFDKFTIYDRYIYDFLVDPRRSRIYLPYWIRKIFSDMVIQPRLVFVLLTDAKIIYARKQELTINEINRQLLEFSKLTKSNKRFVVIDASQSPEKMVEQALKIIIERFTFKVGK